MKDMLQVQDYLFSYADVGDWEGEEEVVAERLNELIHHAWNILPEDLDCETIDRLIEGIWQHLRGDLALLEADIEELTDWVTHYINSSLDEQM
ncbi:MULTISPECIES: hypothetical protein [unclassified Pseudoalteromonas]|uniref:hypothetical protein n=1 Tax=unclassified Pseudoalteromonas TaxID=194690 RepID=UPI003014DEB4